MMMASPVVIEFKFREDHSPRKVPRPNARRGSARDVARQVAARPPDGALRRAPLAKQLKRPRRHGLKRRRSDRADGPPAQAVRGDLDFYPQLVGGQNLHISFPFADLLELLKC